MRLRFWLHYILCIPCYHVRAFLLHFPPIPGSFMYTMGLWASLLQGKLHMMWAS